MRNGDGSLILPRLPSGRAFPGVRLIAATAGSDGRRDRCVARQDGLAGAGQGDEVVVRHEILHGFYQPRAQASVFTPSFARARGW